MKKRWRPFFGYRVGVWGRDCKYSRNTVLVTVALTTRMQREQSWLIIQRINSQQYGNRVWGNTCKCRRIAGGYHHLKRVKKGDGQQNKIFRWLLRYSERRCGVTIFKLRNVDRSVIDFLEYISNLRHHATHANKLVGCTSIPSVFVQYPLLFDSVSMEP